MKGYYIENFGCRAAQADGSAIERQLADLSFQRVDASEAEVVVLNTCTVTSAADQDARAAIRRVHRQQSQAKILVTGCYAQRAPEEIATMDGVTWVVGNSHKSQIGNIIGGGQQTDFVPVSTLQSSSLGQSNNAADIYVSDIFAHTELQAAPVFDAIERIRPNLKVQDGCNNRCSFCVIPFVRGQSRSLPIGTVMGEIDVLQRAGYREIVISGINLGRWGRDFSPQMRLIDLIQHILEHSSIEKIRLSSIEPMDWTDELIDLIASSPRISKHAHVPLQSGSDRILRKMHRKYRPWHYAQKLEKIRHSLPTAAIGADVMVGFPGETDALFEESRRFIADSPLTYLHVFTYSPRPGTAASDMSQQVPIEIARDRNRVLRILAAEKNLKFRSGFVGQTLDAITLNRKSEQVTEALSDNYVKVEIRGCHQPNQLVKVRVEAVSAQGLIGDLAS